MSSLVLSPRAVALERHPGMRVRRVRGLQLIVVPLVVLAMLPLPLVTIRSAGFGFGTLAAPLILAIGLFLARRRRQPVDVRYLGIFALVMTAAVVSVAGSWLFWNPNVGTSMERGFGHRWIGYQVTALYFLATPFVALAAGMVYAQLERMTSLYVGVLISVTITTLLGIWAWWHNPVNPLDVYVKGVRPNINPDATVFLIALATGVLGLAAPSLAPLGPGACPAAARFAGGIPLVCAQRLARGLWWPSPS